MGDPRSSWIVRKYVVDVTTTVEYANNLGPIIDDAIENDVRTC